MMRIVIITDGYFPGKNYGGPPVSIKNLATLMEYIGFYVITRNHDLNDTIVYPNVSDGWNTIGPCQVKYLEDADFNRRCFNDILDEIDPDIIYLQSLFQSCVFSVLSIAKKRKKTVLLAPRGELCEGAFKKKWKKIPYIILLRIMGLFKNVCYQATSEEEEKAIQKWLQADKGSIHNLINIPTVVTKCDDCKVTKVSGHARLLFISRIARKKNLLFAIQALKMIKQTIEFDVYGPKEDTVYWKECQNAAESLPGNVVMNYMGVLEHEKVMTVLREYDALLFPTFSENYGHIIIEAMLSRCPVIISDQTPWNDLEEFNAGWSLPLDDISKFRTAIEIVANNNCEDQEELRERTYQYACDKIDLQRLQKAYLSAFEKIAKRRCN